MFNGKYVYLEELDSIVTSCMFYSAMCLLAEDYDVIIDCGNLTNERRKSWLNLTGHKVAVVFPRKDKEWHINNRITNRHGKTDLGKIWEAENSAYELINENEYNSIIRKEEL